MSSLSEFSADLSNGTSQSFADYQGKVLLIVNTASECGFTYQYDGLEKLHNDYKDKGLVVLGFPCNQFGKQEPGDNSAIAEFCRINHGVTFPLFAKVEVNGSNTIPLFAHLKKAAPGLLGSEKIKWNFTKFLVAKNGHITRYASATKPAKLVKDIERALAA